MFNFDPNDPRKYGLMQMALALMGSKGGNLAQNFGQAGLMGMQGYQTQRAMNAREKEEQQQAQMRQMQMEQARQQQADQQRIAGVYSQNTMPGNLAPNDDDGNQMPQAPQGLNLEGLRGGLMAAGPAGLREAAAVQGMMPQPVKPKMAFAPNGQVVDMNNLQPGQNYAKTPDWLDPRYVDVQTKIGESRRPQVSVQNVGEREEQKQLGALRVKNYADLQGAAAAARKEVSLLSGLEKIPLETGKLTPANATVAAWLTAAGAKNEDLKRIASGAQTFEAFTNDLVMQQQLAQKGPQTESDAKRLQATQAQLSNTPEANQLNIAFRKAMAKRTIEQERFFSDWQRKNKGTLDGAEEAWFGGKGGTSIWEEPELKKFQTRGGVLRFDSQGNPL